MSIAFIMVVVSCSNSGEFETGEIKTLQLLKLAFEQPNRSKIFVDSRDLLNRKQIDKANIPILFVELETGQNGTLTPYPDKGVGQTWLGADGATITLERGIIKASRGLGDDLMGSSILMPSWDKIGNTGANYTREIKYLSGNNKIIKHSLECNIKKYSGWMVLDIWDLEFRVRKFEELCHSNAFEVTNTFYVDNRGIVRKSKQFHGSTLGQVTIERLDR